MGKKNVKQTIKILALLMIAQGIPENKIRNIYEITLHTLYNWHNDFLVKGMGIGRNRE